MARFAVRLPYGASGEAQKRQAHGQTYPGSSLRVPVPEAIGGKRARDSAAALCGERVAPRQGDAQSVRSPWRLYLKGVTGGYVSRVAG